MNRDYGSPRKVSDEFMPLGVDHALKAWPPFFGDVASGAKTFEVRTNDRDYKVGDVIRLDEWDPESGDYTRRVCYRRISYVMLGGSFGIDALYVVLGLRKLSQSDG